MPSVIAQAARAIAASVTVSGALTRGSHNPVDASSGVVTMTLPSSGSTAGANLSVEKIDSSGNPVILAGSIRGVTTTVSLTLQHETMELVADSTGSWWPIASLTAEVARASAAEASKQSIPSLSVASDLTLLPFHAALANRKNKRVNIVWKGDSTVHGYPVTSYDRTAPQQLAAALRALHPTPGVTGGRGYIPAYNGGISMWPAAVTGGTLDLATGYGAQHTVYYATGSGFKVIWTLSGPVTSFDICQLTFSGGSPTTGYYKVDGGSAVPFATNSASNTEIRTNIAAAASSTIEVGWNAAGYLFLEGICEYNGDENAGIQVHNAGLLGETSLTHQSSPTPAGWPQAVAALTPDLMIFTDGINDRITVSGGPCSSATYATRMTAAIAKLRAASVTCPVVLAMSWDVESPSYSYVEPWANYVSAAQTIAAADPAVLVVDMSQRMPATNAANTYGLYAADQVHASTGGSGYMLKAQILAKTVSPR